MRYLEVVPPSRSVLLPGLLANSCRNPRKDETIGLNIATAKGAA